MTAIIDIVGREILDSRGNPTVEVDVRVEGGHLGRAAVPAGASTGTHEAVERRDGGERFGGLGVRAAVDAVNGELFDALSGFDATDQLALDRTMGVLDGTNDKSRLGANAILGISLAAAKAAAGALGLPLYRYVGGSAAHVMPVPLMNVINGGAHADNALDLQEFMVVPLGAESFVEAVHMGAQVSRMLRGHLSEAGHNTNVGDEGGFAPGLRNSGEALDFLVRAIESAGFRPAEQVAIALDPAASEFYRDGVYDMKGEGRRADAAELVDWYTELAGRYPIVSIEDGMAGGRLGRLECLNRGDRRQSPTCRRRRLRYKRRAPSLRHRARRRQCDAGQGQPGGNPERDSRVSRACPSRRLSHGDVTPIGRDRGYNDRRSRRRHELRAGQDRRA